MVALGLRELLDGRREAPAGLRVVDVLREPLVEVLRAARLLGGALDEELGDGADVDGQPIGRPRPAPRATGAARARSRPAGGAAAGRAGDGGGAGGGPPTSPSRRRKAARCDSGRATSSSWQSAGRSGAVFAAFRTSTRASGPIPSASAPSTRASTAGSKCPPAMGTNSVLSTRPGGPAAAAASAWSAAGAVAPSPPAVITYTSCSRTCLSRWMPRYWKSRVYSWDRRDTIS